MGALGELREARGFLTRPQATDAVADAVVDLAVVDFVEAEPVEEEAVNGVALDDLVQDIEGPGLVVLAAWAHADQTAVVLGLTGRRHKAPLGVLGGDTRGDFREVHA